MLSSSTRAKQILNIFLIGTMLLNLFYFAKPTKTYAADQCKNINLNPVPIVIKYSKETKDNLPKNDILKITDFTNTTSFSTTSVKVDLIAKYNGTSAGNKVFWIQYLSEEKLASAYIQYSVTGNIEHSVDGTKTEDIPFTFNTSGKTTISKTYPIDNKKHTFKLTFYYKPTQQYCETDTWDFSSEPGKYVYNSPFEHNKSQPIYFTDDKCKELKGQVESQICTSVTCLRELYENGAGAGAESANYWNPGAKPPIFDELISGNWTSNDLTAAGYTKLQSCKAEKDKLSQMSSQYTSSGCTETIIWSKECHFNPNASTDTEIDPNNPSSTADSLGWLNNQIGSVATKIEDIPTQQVSSTCIANNCRSGDNADIPYRYVCEAICWVNEGIMNIVNWGFEYLRGALSTETKNPITPNPDKYLNNTSTSNTSSTTSTTTNNTTSSGSNTGINSGAAAGTINNSATNSSINAGAAAGSVNNSNTTKNSNSSSSNSGTYSGPIHGTEVQ